MAGESVISTKDIEKRAEDLETKIATEKETADKAAADKAAADEKAAADKAAADEAAKGGKQTPGQKKEPNDPVELRRWATRTSMELSEVKKQIAGLAEILNKGAKKQVDYAALAKDPAKLQAAIEAREQEMIQEHKAKFDEQVTQATAEITQYESDRRMTDTENYPLWGELLPLMKKLAAPTEAQPSGDPRINFQQHPKKVLDDLYGLAQEIAESDPNFKKPAPKAPANTAKTYSQEEHEAAIQKAREEAAAEAASNLKNEMKGAGVGGMGKGSSKSQPGKVDKTVLWNMPLGDLKDAIQKASE
jgi:hypothetical protein